MAIISCSLSNGGRHQGLWHEAITAPGLQPLLGDSVDDGALPVGEVLGGFQEVACPCECLGLTLVATPREPGGPDETAVGAFRQDPEQINVLGIKLDVCVAHGCASLVLSGRAVHAVQQVTGGLRRANTPGPLTQ
jgi:hypothetical protein